MTAAAYDDGTVGDQVLDRRRAGGGAGDRPLVFVTVGTDHHPFHRMTDWVDSWLADEATPPVRCVVQHGTSRPPRLAESSAYLSHAELTRHLAEATAVVCHGGPATITDSRRAGRLPIVVPRESGRGEHVDDHQVAFSSHLDRYGEAKVARTESAFRAELDAAVRAPASVRLASQTDATRPAVDRFERLVADLFDAPAPGPAPGAAESAPGGPSATERPVVLYIGGLGRSGSTLLDRLLGQLPGFVSAGEVVHLWERGVGADELCGCGRHFSECPFWTEVGRAAFGPGSWAAIAPSMHERRLLVDRNRFIPKLAVPALFPGYARRMRGYARDLGQLYRGISQVSGCGVVVDSSKHSSLAYLLRHVPGIDLRVVHMVRDGRGVVHSWGKQVRKPEVVGDVAYMPVYSPTRSATLWSVHNALVGGLARFGVPSIVVRYEDLVRDPRPEVDRVLTLAGVDPATVRTDFLGPDWVELAPTHTVAGNPMRFKRGRLQLRADEEWRTSMGTRERRLVSALTWPLAARYGYRSARNRSSR